MHLLHGELGPERELEHYWVGRSLVAKVGSDSFLLDACPATFDCLSSAIHPLHVNTVSSVFNRGGGLGGESVGVRLDLGDEMHFTAGKHNNFRMALGPFMRV